LEKLEQKGTPTSCCTGRFPYTPRANKVIDYAIDEARQSGNDLVGSKHILLGLLREDEAVAAQVLMNLGLQLDQVRTAIQAIPQGCND